ncbi:MAG: molybdopterin-dependent oxidoreductase, partial [Chloroflexi bacterium]|nr:molybdopterin-dependent oxidoreductase [Chloroflexota bacterium]
MESRSRRVRRSVCTGEPPRRRLNRGRDRPQLRRAAAAAARGSARSIPAPFAASVGAVFPGSGAWDSLAVLYNVGGESGGTGMVLDFFRSRRKPAADIAGHVPPGQYVTDKWPVLHYGSVPSISKEQWNLRIFGLVDEEPRTLTFADLLRLPQTTVTADVHCVTRWSRLGAHFEGVLFTDILEQVRLKPEAAHAMIH